MNNFTMNSYEMKRDIVNFSKKVSEGVNKPTSKFVMDMQYGLAKSGSCLISEIARTLDEVKKNIDLENPIVLFDDNDEKELMISYTKGVLPANKKEYTVVFVYGLSEEHPMKLLTNIESAEKEDIIKIVRLYLSRWRIEEHFRGKKQEYNFENMRLRTLKSMNNLNMMLTIHLGYIAMLADKIEKKLLVIKIIEASISLRRKIIVWLSQLARGIKEILKYCHTGIKEWQNIEQRPGYKQMQLKL